MEERAEDVPLLGGKPIIGIVYNLKKGLKNGVPDAEAEYDSIDTVYAIRNALEKAGLDVKLLEADAQLPEKLRAENLSMVFNIAEGFSGRGREAQIPALLNMLGIPFTGSDETTLCVSLDKALTKRLMATYHVRTPKSVLIENGVAPHIGALKFPLIVKPNAEGSSKGISGVSIVKSREELRALLKRNGELYGSAMLAEEYIDGREFTIGILGNGKTLRVFPPMEIIFRRTAESGYRVYDYTVKQDYKRYIDYKCPAELDKESEAEMIRMALKVYTALGCRDFSRVDFRLDAEGRAYFIEINPLPGLAPGYSDYPMLAEFCGVSYDELVASILRAGAQRLGIELGRWH
jgi:D-alanine-D-alanine ligase